MICLTFNISENWLRNGEGDMFVKSGIQYEVELLDIFRHLSEASRKLVIDHAKGVVQLEHTLLANEQPAP
jgi:hypothetical protein